MTKQKTIRYAVIGLGHLSQAAILPAFKSTHQSELGLLVSGDETKINKLSRKHDVPACHYEDLEAALKREDITAAFIVLPNTMHREYTERTSAAGVHVLCEKPMATNVADAKAMIRACDRARVKLMIAYRLHFTPSHLWAIQYAQGGRLGTLRTYHSVFAMQVDDDNIRVKDDTGGGPLLDIGIYCLNAARYLFRAEPTEVSAMSARSDDPRFREIYEMVSATLRFPEDRIATFTCSFGANHISEFQLIGTEAILQSEGAFGYKAPAEWTIIRGERRTTKAFPHGDQFAAEMDYFSDCILHNRKPEPSGEEGLADIRIITAISQAARTGKAVRLSLPKRTMAPGWQQRVRRSPRRKRPALVKASAPSK